MLFRLLIITLFTALTAFSQVPPIEPGVSHELAKWRTARYSDVRYKLNLTLEKMSPVLKGTMEIRVMVEGEKGRKGEGETALPGTQTPSPANAGSSGVTDVPIILDWRKIVGHEKDSTIANLSLNGVVAVPTHEGIAPMSQPQFHEASDHIVIMGGVVPGENVIKLDFTSPILTSGSAITRYVDKEDGAEYIYSLFVPSDASTAFPVFDQPDLKAKFSLTVFRYERDWEIISNMGPPRRLYIECLAGHECPTGFVFPETRPISTYVFAFAAGPWQQIGTTIGNEDITHWNAPHFNLNVYVRKSQAKKYEAHQSAVANLTNDGIKYLESYFDYKFPFPKYDLVLIPEFPFGGMEHAGATFLRESSVIFPTEPTKNDQISRANLIFHETAHQWFGDTVTMKWFDDLWLKEGFAEFMAYKTLEKVMPEANAWKVFYERNKQAAYLTDSTKGTTPIYQKIDNLSAAKSAYGNIVYRKAPSFLRQAEYYLGEEKFQTAVRAFLKKHEYANAGWEDLVSEFGTASGQDMKEWGNVWVKRPGLPIFTTPKVATVVDRDGINPDKNSPPSQSKTVDTYPEIVQKDIAGGDGKWPMKFRLLVRENGAADDIKEIAFGNGQSSVKIEPDEMRAAIKALTKANDRFPSSTLIFPNYQDYGYGTFLLDDKSREFVLKNIQYEKDDFLRTMMWGSLWDSVRAAELNPKNYVELVVGNFDPKMMVGSFGSRYMDYSEKDEGTIQSLLGRVSTAMNYYVSDAQRTALAPKVEAVLIDKIQHAATPGQRITFYRAFLGIASTERARNVLKQILKNGSAADSKFPLKTKDRFDIVTRLTILGDPDVPKLLAELEKTEIGDDAKRYAYAAKAGAPTAESKAKYWNDFLNNKDISESWIEAAMGPFNSIRHAALTQQYLTRALAELPNLKRSRKIFFVNGWLGAFIGGQRDEKSLAIVNKFLADNPNLDKDLRLKVLENVDLIERAVKIRSKYGKS